MNGAEGWRVITCAGGAQDKTIVNKIMLRYRPIAPKPVTGESSSGTWKPENKSRSITKGRVKRKYVRVKKDLNNTNKEYCKKRNKKITASSDQERTRERSRMSEDIIASKKKALTLQLLPEKTDLTQVKESSPSVPVRGSWSGFDNRMLTNSHVHQEKKEPPMLCNLNKQVIGGMGGFVASDRLAEKRVAVVVESVAETCMDGVVGGLGCTDVEKMENLKRDTCPGFISDGSYNVKWLNDAYKNMVATAVSGQENDGQSPESVTVLLVIKEKWLPRPYYAAFTCWVRLQYTWQKEKCSQMVPCDVWRMDFGGFAWRLDVKAALSLGL